MISGLTKRSVPSSRDREAVFQAILACLVMFITGSSFSLGVFTVAVEQQAVPNGVLDGVWPSAMGLMNFVSAPIMIFTGLFLESDSAAYFDSRFSFGLSKSARVRILASISTLSYALFALAGVAADHVNPTMLRIAVGTQSIPLGINYLLTTELLVAWIPDRPGLAVGCGQMSFGLGTVLLASLFNNLIEMFDAVSAIYITAGVLTVAVLPSVLLRWPRPSASPYSAPDDHQAPLLVDPQAGHALLYEDHQPIKLAWHQLCTMRSFWLYIAIVFTAGAGYAFVPYFFKLGQLFGKEMSLLVRIYQMTSLTATVVGLLGSMWTDSLGFGDGYWYSGAKNLCTGLMALQTTFFLSLVPLSSHMNFAGFVFILSLQIILSAIHAGCLALLARDLFGSANSCLVFGMGAGLAMGSGEGFSAELMSMVEKLMGITMESPPSSYNMHYIISSVLSFGGLVSLVAVDQSLELFKVSFATQPRTSYDSMA